MAEDGINAWRHIEPSVCPGEFATGGSACCCIAMWAASIPLAAAASPPSPPPLAIDAGSGEAAFPPLASAWRVVNAQSVSDHWCISELVMLDAEGKSTVPLVRDPQGWSKRLYNGDWTDKSLSTCGWTEESHACGSSFAYEFERPVARLDEREHARVPRGG